jgi:hypothetical protein
LLSKVPGVEDTRRRWTGERLYRNGRDGKEDIEALSDC